MTDTTLRVGIAGLGRRGRHYFERLGLRGDCLVTDAFDPAGVRVEGPLAAACRFVENWRDLVSSSADTIVIAMPGEERAEIAAAALRAAKSIALDGYLADDRAAAARLSGLAEEQRLRLMVLNEALWEGEFLTAQAAVSTNELGAIQAVQHVSWSPPLVGAGDDRHDDGIRRAATRIDQAIRLVRDRPISAFSLPTEGPTVGAPSSAGGFSLGIRFAGGGTAFLEERNDTSLPCHPGWMITGTTGGYRKGKLYRRLADGEVYDLPFDEIASNHEGLYDDFHARACRRQAESIEHDLMVAAVLDALRRSAAEQRVERV